MVREKRQGVKEKCPGFKTQRILGFQLKSPRGISRLSFLCGKGPVSGATGSHSEHPSVQPSLLLSLIKGSSGLDSCSAHRPAHGEAPTAHTYPAARDPPSLPDMSSPGTEQKSRDRCVTAHVDRSVAVRPLGSAPSNGSQNSNSSTSVCDPEDTAVPLLPGEVDGGRLRLRCGFWFEFRRVRRGGCADLARKTTPCPARPGRRAECFSHPPTGHMLEIGLPMLMRTRANAHSLCPLPSGILLHHSSLLS